MTFRPGDEEELADHDLIAIDQNGQLCACGVRSRHHLEHLGEIALRIFEASQTAQEKRQVEWNRRHREKTIRGVASDLDRTRLLLNDLDARQARLRRRADRLGLTSYAERADWLIAQRSRDEHLAASRAEEHRIVNAALLHEAARFTTPIPVSKEHAA